MRPEKPLPMVTLRDFDRPMKDYWGKTIPRRVRIGKMGKSLERLTYNRSESLPFLRALEKSAGIARGEKARRLVATLYQEGLYCWVLRAQVSAGKYRRTLCLTISKDAVKYAQVTRREHNILKTLGERNPGAVVSVQEGGDIPLVDDRYGGALYGYFSHFLTGFTELGIDAQHRFSLVGQEEAIRMSEAQSQETRARMVAALASFFDPKSGSAQVDVEVNSGDFMGRLDEGRVEVRLIAARHLRSGFSGAGFIKRLLSPMGNHGEKPFFIVPDSSRLLVSSLLEGLIHPLGSKKEAVEFLKQSLVQAGRKKLLVEHPSHTFEDLLEQLKTGKF
jgi:hypothetical protein